MSKFEYNLMRIIIAWFILLTDGVLIYGCIKLIFAGQWIATAIFIGPFTLLWMALSAYKFYKDFIKENKFGC